MSLPRPAAGGESCKQDSFFMRSPVQGGIRSAQRVRGRNLPYLIAEVCSNFSLINFLIPHMFFIFFLSQFFTLDF